MVFTITAILKAKNGKKELLKRELISIIEPSRDEEGCISYNVHESLDDENVFVFQEVWESEGAFQKHIETKHYKQYRTNIVDLIQSREVHRLHAL